MSHADGPVPGLGSSTGRQRRWSELLTALVLVLVLFGAACLGYVGYQVWGTGVAAHRAYDQERAAIEKSWKAPSPGSDRAATRSGVKPPHQSSDKTGNRPVPGDAIGLISIPSIGVRQVPILEGVGADVLARGVGHYPGSAAPGAVGNFAVAGHRITHGQPFANLLQLNVGDRIVVETRTDVFTYAVQVAPRTLTVEDTQSSVVDPVPGHPRQQPTQRLITLTTCQDLFHSPDRSVGFGRLISTRIKSTGDTAPGR